MEENKNPNLSQESISNRISQLKKGQSNNNNSFNRSSNGFPNALPQTDPSNNELDENGNELDNNEEVVDETLNEQTSFFENSASSLIPSQENSIQKVDVNDFATKLIKAKKIIAIISASIPFVLPVIVIIIVAAVVMGQVMTVRDNINQLSRKFTTGIEKFVNFAQGEGWMTNEDSFFNYLDEQYNLFSTNVGGDELDIPLIAATIHYSKQVDFEKYEETEKEEQNYKNDDFEQLGGTITKDKTAAFYDIARDKVGGLNTIVPGQKRLLGHLASTKTVIVFVNADVAGDYWTKYSKYFVVSTGEQIEDIYWNTPLSLTNPGALVDAYNKMLHYQELHNNAFVGMKYDGANTFYEVGELMHHLKMAIEGLFPETKDSLKNNQPIDTSGLSGAQPEVGMDDSGNNDMSNTEKYIPVQDRGLIPVPFVVLETNYGYEEYQDKKQIVLEMKSVLKENGIELTDEEDIKEQAKNSSNSQLRSLYEQYEEINDKYMYSYTHYLEKVYIPYTYFYKQEYSTADIDIIIEEIYDQRDFYNYLIGDKTNYMLSNTACSGGCTYNVDGKEITNLKVRLMQCRDGTWGEPVPGEELVDFETYILGVVYAEIGSNPPAEAAKTQAIAARNFALTRPKRMGNAAGLSLEKEGDIWILSIRNCTEDQVYCDPVNGCSNTTKPSESGNSTTIYSGVNTKEYPYFGPLPEDSVLRTAVAEVAGKVLLDEDGQLVKTGYTNTNQQKWKKQANEGMDYTEILFAEYEETRTITEGKCTSVCSTTGDYAQWKQCGAPWSNIVIGDGKSICDIGCLATSVSIQLARSGVPLQNINGEFNPGTFVNAIKPNGFIYRDENGNSIPGGTLFVYDSASWIAPNFKYQGDLHISLTGKTKTQKAYEIQNLINQGCYVVMEVKGNGGGQHWVAVDYVSGETVYMMDPASTEVNAWKQYPHHWTSQAVCYKVTS